MCGIVGYIGDRDITSVLLVGLERLSYRGYDSSGIAVLSNAELSWWKKDGKLHELQNAIKNLSIKAQVGIGHTRWATHGKATETNAHPHINHDKKIAVVHNGIIENYQQIKSKLLKEGYIFESETDTEVIVHLVSMYMNKNLEEAVEKAVMHFEGAYAIAVIAEDDPDKMVVCRKGSPLLIGVGQDENYIGSDINAIVPHTKDIIYLEEDELAIIQKNDISVKKIGGPKVEKTIHQIKWTTENAEKSGSRRFTSVNR